MPKYMTRMCYSSGSWARMVKSPGDRSTAIGHVMKSLGGSLECLYWEVGTEDAVAIGDLPDSVSAVALNEALSTTGAFKSVETRELLTQEQLIDTLVLAGDAAVGFEVPGQPD